MAGHAYHRMWLSAFRVACVVALSSACGNGFDKSRNPPERGTLGEELYGAYCDRFGAQLFPEDLSGSSYRSMCHRGVTGRYSDSVNIQNLVSTPNADSVERIEALGRHREELVTAFDRVFPTLRVPVNVTRSALETSCRPPGAGQPTFDTLHRQLAEMLGRMTQFYQDGTIPASTRALAEVVDSFLASPEAQRALARNGAREGYRPLKVALGAMRPVLAYPRLRELTNSLVHVFAPDSDPYSVNAEGGHTAVPGVANARMQKFLEVAREELRDATGVTSTPPLKVLADPVVLGAALSRPRTLVELLKGVFLAEDSAFGWDPLNLGGEPDYITLRDPRGVASIRLHNGRVPQPFLDLDGDGMADLDDLGRFMTIGGKPAALPFSKGDGVPRDTHGRALDPVTGMLVYDSLDTSHSFTASFLANLKALLDTSSTDGVGSLFDALGALQVVLGSRDGAPLTTQVYTYEKRPTAPVTASPPTQPEAEPQLVTTEIRYDAFHPEDSSLLDLVHAAGQLMGSRSSADSLALMQTLFVKYPSVMARVLGGLNSLDQIAKNHSEIDGLGESTIGDDFVQFFVDLCREEGLGEDLIKVFGDPQVVRLGPVLASFMRHSDPIAYNREDINGKPWNRISNNNDDVHTPVDRNAPDRGFNQSSFQRSLRTVRDTNNVTYCNKENAVLHARGLIPNSIVQNIPATIASLAGFVPSTIFSTVHKSIYYPNPYFAAVAKTKAHLRECEAMKVDNMAIFYLRSMLGRAVLEMRDPTLANGIALPFGLSFGATTAAMIQESSRINGFWSFDEKLRPKPQFLNRLVFFDTANDSPTDEGRNATTNRFVRDLNGKRFPSVACSTRIIKDPVDQSRVVLRDCADGEWANDRNEDTIFTWETMGFYDAVIPALTQFANHGREDLFIKFFEILYQHWSSDSSEISARDESNHTTYITGDGLMRFEPMLADMLNSDIFPALYDLSHALQEITIAHCDAVDPATRTCIKSHPRTGVTIFAEVIRDLVDPVRAAASGVKDRAGHSTVTSPDGSTTKQLTPLALLLNAFGRIGEAFDPKNPSIDADQLARWKSAKQAFVDRFLSITGTKEESAFANVAFGKMVPHVIDLMRTQLLAQCPLSFTAPYPRCNWAHDALTTNLATAIRSPVVSTAVDFADAIRADDTAREELELLAKYLLDARSSNDALAAMLASIDDLLQSLDDHETITPMLRILSDALAPSVVDADGKTTKKGFMDATLDLLGKTYGHALGPNDTENCGRELDPNQILPIILQNLVTPMPGTRGEEQPTPVEVILKAIVDINRGKPGSKDTLLPQDYELIAASVKKFLTDPTNGLEKFYSIVQATSSSPPPAVP